MENPQQQPWPKAKKSHNGKLIGIILIVLGTSYIAKHFIPWIPFSFAVAILAVIFGIFLVARK